MYPWIRASELRDTINYLVGMVRRGTFGQEKTFHFGACKA